MHRPHPHTIRHRLAMASTAISMVGGLFLGLAGASGAQNDGTGAATPLPPTDCRIMIVGAEPADATAVESPAASPVASPVTANPASPMASPVTGDLATPIASPVAAESSADPNAPLIDELYATSEALFACLNDRNFETYAQLTGDAFRGQLFGSDQPLSADEFVILAESLADADNRIVEVTAFERIDDATVSVEVTYVSAYQQRTGIWTFSMENV
ncbi:MAG: alanine and proline-rich secreted protein Apa, partial [Chloroflexota bacterium]|nr:alanine and proline-rich secreted protein Apa [Chloroflexota bacterium]